MSGRRRRQLVALLVSLLGHALLLSALFGAAGVGVPGLRWPGGDRRAEAPELRLVTITAPSPPAPPAAAAHASQHKPRAATTAGRSAKIVVAALDPPARSDAAPSLQALRASPLQPPPAAQSATQEPAAPQDTMPQQDAPQQAARLAAQQEAPQQEAKQEATHKATEQQAAEQQEAERLEQERQRMAEQEAQRQESQQRELARRQVEEAAAARLEAERDELARQEAARSEAARAEAARADADRTNAARADADRAEAAKAEAAQQEAARQEASRAEAAQREAARLQAAQHDTDRREAARRAMGRQLDEEAARREAAADSRRPPLPPLPSSVSGTRRGRLFGRADANAELVRYAQAWAQKIELNLTFDLVRDAARQAHTAPLVTVALRSDGSVESVTFVLSSGVPRIDDAVRRIVHSQTPYQPFPPGLAKDFDVVEIRRTWHFDSAVRLY